MSTTAGAEAATPTPTRPDAACGAVERVRAGLVSGRGWQGIDVTSLPRNELLSTHRDLARMRREIDAMLAYSSAEIARRSSPDDGQEGLAKREGYRTPEELVASISGGSTGEAHRLIEVGDALAREENDASVRSEAGQALGAGADGNREDGGGEDGGGESEPEMIRLSPRFATVRDTVRAGKLSIDAANLITRMLTRIWDRRESLGIELGDIERVERVLVERAHGLSSNRFARVVRQLEAQMDSGRHALTEELQRQERSLTMYEEPSGMFVLRARLDAETAAPVRAALDALVGNALHNRRDHTLVTKGGVDSSRDASQNGDVASRTVRALGQQGDLTRQVAMDDRTVLQIRADALAALARHCLGCDSDDVPSGSTSVVVRLTLKDLQDGTGVADIDGGAQPVCISTARRMAANGRVIPIVLGGKDEVLNLGRGDRKYNYAQRIALIERDGGCAFCGAPPAYTEAHHIRWWARDCGPTDLDNGLLLCSTCHHRIHRDDWEIIIAGGQVWFKPPAAIDRERVPRLGGRARFGVPRVEAA